MMMSRHGLPGHGIDRPPDRVEAIEIGVDPLLRAVACAAVPPDPPRHDVRTRQRRAGTPRSSRARARYRHPSSAAPPPARHRSRVSPSWSAARRARPALASCAWGSAAVLTANGSDGAAAATIASLASVQASKQEAECRRHVLRPPLPREPVEQGGQQTMPRCAPARTPRSAAPATRGSRREVHRGDFLGCVSRTGTKRENICGRNATVRPMLHHWQFDNVTSASRDSPVWMNAPGRSAKPAQHRRSTCPGTRHRGAWTLLRRSA